MLWWIKEPKAKKKKKKSVKLNRSRYLVWLVMVAFCTCWLCCLQNEDLKCYKLIFWPRWTSQQIFALFLIALTNIITILSLITRLACYSNKSCKVSRHLISVSTKGHLETKFTSKFPSQFHLFSGVMFCGTQLLNVLLCGCIKNLYFGQYKHLLKAHVLYKTATVNEWSESYFKTLELAKMTDCKIVDFWQCFHIPRDFYLVWYKTAKARGSCWQSKWILPLKYKAINRMLSVIPVN